MIQLETWKPVTCDSLIPGHGVEPHIGVVNEFTKAVTEHLNFGRESVIFRVIIFRVL